MERKAPHRKSVTIPTTHYNYIRLFDCAILLRSLILSETTLHEKTAVILNTNLEVSRWVNVLYEEQMTATLTGGLMHHCNLIKVPLHVKVLAKNREWIIKYKSPSPHDVSEDPSDDT